MEGTHRDIREMEVGDYFEALNGNLIQIAEIVYHDKKGNCFKPKEWEQDRLPWNWTITGECGTIVDMWGVNRYHKRGDIEAD